MSHHASSWAIEQRPTTSDGRSDPTAKLVLLVLADSADETGVTWRGSRSLADRCGLSPSGVRSALGRLQACGLIERRERTRSNGSRTSSVVVLAPGENRCAMGSLHGHPALADDLAPRLPGDDPRPPQDDPRPPGDGHPNPSREPVKGTATQQPSDRSADARADEPAPAAASDVAQILTAHPPWASALMGGADMAVASLMASEPDAPWSRLAHEALSQAQAGELDRCGPRRALELRLGDWRAGDVGGMGTARTTRRTVGKRRTTALHSDDLAGYDRHVQTIGTGGNR